MRISPLPPRRRSSALECLEIFRRQAPGASLQELLVFLYVCENEGLNMRELAHLTGQTDSHVSRLVRGLAAPGRPGVLPPARGLVELRVPSGDRRSRTLHLHEAGRRLRDALERTIAAASPIVDDAMRGAATIR